MPAGILNCELRFHLYTRAMSRLRDRPHGTSGLNPQRRDVILGIVQELQFLSCVRWHFQNKAASADSRACSSCSLARAAQLSIAAIVNVVLRGYGRAALRLS